jgi:hypothetical protein
MKKEKETNCCSKIIHKKCHCHPQGGAIYGLGLFGALFYFLQNATTFSAVLIGIFKSIFWPAFLLFRILTDLHI